MTAQPPLALSKAGRVREITVYFLKLGTTGFGGPVALVGQMERELVVERGWLSREEMREAVAVCQTLPGPLAIQVGIFIAYLRGGQFGAWAGGWCFILPNFLIVAGLAALYVAFDGLPWMTAVFYGVSPAVIALILYSTWRLTKLGMDDAMQWVIAGVAFAVTVILQAEVAAIFIVAGLVGIAWYGSLIKGGGGGEGRRPPSAAGRRPASCLRRHRSALPYRRRRRCRYLASFSCFFSRPAASPLAAAL
jgi:chromate transporter